jgi:hypothetical protein
MRLARWLIITVATREGIDILAALIIAAATVVYTTFAYKQWHTMRDQLAEMRSSSEQTAATIAALHEQAEAMNKQLAALHESNRLNQASLAANLRAWLTPSIFGSDVDLETASHPKLHVEMANLGRQPAENVRFNLHLDYGEVSAAQNADPETFPVWSKHADELAWESACKDAMPIPGTPLVYPTGNAYTTYSAEDTRIDLREIRARKKLLVFWGCFGYRTFGTVRHTSFCVYLDPDPRQSIRNWSYSYCPAGNHAD